jgi:hypothetical protein
MRALFSLLALIAFGGGHLALANQLPFEIGRDVDGFNVPYVSITVCAPGTQDCRTIDRIKLDTGSEGLRIFKSALQGLELPIERDAGGNDLTLCAGFAGGDGDWGPIASADLLLGDELAKGAKVQLVDPDYPSQGITCLPQATDGRNGILGMSTALTSPNGKTYFSCGSSGCAGVSLVNSQEPLSPMAYVAEDKNGFIVRTPSVPETGARNLTGAVIFGLGTRDNNRVKAERTVCHVRPDDFFQLSYQGKKFWTKFDSGTNAINLPPSAVSVPFCPNSSVYLCPAQPVTFSVALLNADGSTCASLDVGITGDFHGPGSSYQSWVLPALGESWGGATSDQFMLGVPFFFGKDIYYGVAGQVSPLGAGPLVAF